MKKKYLLPELNGNVPVEAADTLGCWENRDKAYDFLLDNLHMDFESTESIFDGGSNGIPHIYEQMILFTDAFYDPKHPDHQRAVQEWRAVLMLMAFKRIKNLNLDVVKVDLTGSSKNLFICAAADFVPDDPPVLYQTTWDFLYVLLLESSPIAIFSPTTLVCPAKQFKDRINRCKMDWIQFGRVGKVEQPILKFSEMGHEYSCLTEWLRRLQGELYNADETNPAVNTRYEFLMNEFSDFIKCYAHGKFPEAPPVFREHIYDEMNSSLRTEYRFLNRCCDFKVLNKKLKFLENKFTPDIFQDKLMLLVYDRKQNAMFDRENLSRLHQIVDHIMTIDQRKIITVTESGGEELPVFALLPFHRKFICELVEREISPDEFFAAYEVVYNKVYDRMEISLSIRDFPFSYQKNYERDQWETVTGEDMLPIYLWPKEQLADGWKAYYVYASCDKQKMTLDAPYQGAALTKYYPSTGGGGAGAFQLIESEKFPSYLRLVFNQVSGYLPVKTLNADLEGAGDTARIYFDVGHTNTSIMIVLKGGKGDSQDRRPLSFHTPSSVWVAGNNHLESGVYANFLTPGNIPNAQENIQPPYFKNMLHDMYNYHRQPDSYTVRPFKDGHILFSGGAGGDVIVSMLNFDYPELTERGRKRVHIYLEQILLYAVYEVVLAKCVDVEVRFLHRSQKEQLGELKGLWAHALRQVKGKTGINCWEPRGLDCMDELDALTNYLCLTLLKRNRMTFQNPAIPSSELYISVDIGWKKTLVTALGGAGSRGLTARCAEIPFAGRDISIVGKENDFPCYCNLLSLLLGGPYKFDPDTDEGALLSKFEALYKDDPSNEDYYYGLFDLIALQIEQNNFKVSPDIYNNKMQYRQFIYMLSYNILLLFFEIGCILADQMNDDVRHVQIFLGGNGSKFLRWVANIKDFKHITEANCHELFIAPLQNTILDVLRYGLQIKNSNATFSLSIDNRLGENDDPIGSDEHSGSASSDENAENDNDMPETDPPHSGCIISMTDKPKKQLITGYMFHEVPDAFFTNAIRLYPQTEFLSTLLGPDYVRRFFEAMESITQDLFPDMYLAAPTMEDSDSIDITSVIKTWSQAVCRGTIARICGR